MRVINEEFFHIHRKNYYQNQWVLSNTLKTPIDEYNHFYNGLLNDVQLPVSMGFEQFELINYLNKELSVLKQFNENLEDQDLNKENILNIKGYAGHVINLLEQTFHSLAHSRKILREIIFENYRLNFFPDLPSRQHCFWLSEKDELLKWWNEFDDNDNKAIYKVSVTGNIFVADASFVCMDMRKATDFFKLAENYWQGIHNSNGDLHQKEILFEGELKIISAHMNPTDL